MIVPQRKSIIVAIRKDNGMSLILHTVQIIRSEIPAHITVTAVVVIPSLTDHLQGNKHSESNGNHTVRTLQLHPTKHSRQSRYAHTYPYSVGIERASVGIVTFARLHRSLIEIHHYSQACHKEQQHYDIPLLIAMLTVPNLPDHAKHSQQ